jgi:hypothetical protein
MNSAIGISAINKLPRDQYGALDLRQVLPLELQAQVTEFLGAAVKAGRLPEPFITGDAKEYECLNLDTYDVLIFRGKVKSLVVQVRTFWKNVRKGYSRSGKDYCLITRAGRKITAKVVEKATCAKRTKNTTELGQLANHYLGKTTVACKRSDVVVSTAYKVLARTDDGRLVSAYDGSEYKIGKWRSETAKPDHGGGFYYYMDDMLAIDATTRGNTFHDSVTAGKVLVLCEVEISGREIEYGGGKWAASRLRVVAELMPVSTD